MATLLRVPLFDFGDPSDTFSRSAAGRGFFPLLTSSLSLPFTDGTAFYITSSLTFSPNGSAPCGGKFHSSLFLPTGIVFSPHHGWQHLGGNSTAIYETFSLTFFSSSQMAVSSMTFSNLPPGGTFHSSLLPPEGIFSLHTVVGNTDTTEGNFTLHCYHQREFFPSTRWLATLTFSNLAPEGRGSRDMGSGGGNFILEKSFTTPGPCLTHYYSRNMDCLKTHTLLFFKTKRARV